MNHNSAKLFTIQDLPKTNNFTSHLPPDPAYPTPADSHNADRAKLGPRLVKNALFTYVRPEPTSNPELLSVSPAALQSLNIDPVTINAPDFIDTVSGSKILIHDDSEFQPNDQESEETQQKKIIYPWAQCYGGYQFGQWAGQLGDGRAISLFEIPTESGKRYELQLKGAGKTPYSRFADGKAVLRSSIREFIVSEALNALGIPSTRALSLVLCPESKVRRETMEPGAIVARFAESWLRIGTFDLIKSRGDRSLLRTLADYVAEHVFEGWNTLPGQFKGPNHEVQRNIDRETIQGEDSNQENRYMRLFREIVRRNAKTVAAWQAYAFTNGVLNTDNTSIYGLSLDFGPFAFLDNYDPDYTPNHDDHMNRYSYRNQPAIIWWNLTRLGEALSDLIGAGQNCDDPNFVASGVAEAVAEDHIHRAENLINKTLTEYRSVYLEEYKRLMTLRLGLKTCRSDDHGIIHTELLNILETFELDYHHTFRKLSNVRMDDLKDDSAQRLFAPSLFHHEGLAASKVHSEKDAIDQITSWLGKWRARVMEDWTQDQDEQRMISMKSVNPKVCLTVTAP